MIFKSFSFLQMSQQGRSQVDMNQEPCVSLFCVVQHILCGLPFSFLSGIEIMSAIGLNEVFEHVQFIAVVDVVDQVSHIVEPSAATSDVSECYDPAFLLPLFTHLLAPGKLFFSFSISNNDNVNMLISILL